MVKQDQKKNPPSGIPEESDVGVARVYDWAGGRFVESGRCPQVDRYTQHGTHRDVR